MNKRGDEGRVGGMHPDLVEVLESAALLQKLVPDAVLVGGAAAARYAGHRASYDHDHVLADLRERFDAVLEAIESESEWVTNRVTPGKIILGRLGGIEAGVRQMIRTTPLETEEVALPSGNVVCVPTPEETLRIKAFLIVRRNQVRDYLDVAALSDRHGLALAAKTLVRMDLYYADESRDGVPVSSQVMRQLGNPRPKDTSTLKDLSNYKHLDERWQAWTNVTKTCRQVAAIMAEPVDFDEE